MSKYTKELSVNEIQELVNKFYPEFINNSNELQIFKNNVLTYSPFTTQLQERFFYTLTTGRHHSVQKYHHMTTEDYINTSYTSQAVLKASNKIDVSFKDLNDKYVALVENAILYSTSVKDVEKKYNYKLQQVLNYMLNIMDKNTEEELNKKSVFLQVNVYNPANILKNSKQYENYMMSGQSAMNENEIFSKTGIFQSLFVLSHKDCLTLQKTFPIGISINDLTTSYTLQNILLRSKSKSTNFIIMNLEKVEKLGFDATSFWVKPSQNISNNLFLEKIPFRSVQRGNSDFDNTREISTDLVTNYSRAIARNFLEILQDNDFVDDNSLISSEIRKPGWNDRELGASLSQTIVDEDNLSNVFIISADMALSNAQHNSYALLKLKKDLIQIGISNIEDIQHYISNIGYKKAKELSVDEINIFFNLIQTVNPILSFNLFMEGKNGKRHAAINNESASQLAYDKAKFNHKIKLQLLASAMNEHRNDYHFYAGTDFSQDFKQTVTSKLKCFDIGLLPMINSSFKKGVEISKLKAANLKKNLHTLTNESELNLDKEEALKLIKVRKIFQSADKKSDNVQGILDLYKENTRGEKIRTLSLKNKLIEYLTDFKEDFSLINIMEAKKIIDSFPKEINKDLKAILQKFKQLLDTQSEFNPDDNIKTKNLEYFIYQLSETGTTVNYDRLLMLVEIFEFIKKQDRKPFNDLFTSDEMIVRLVSVILGYKSTTNTVLEPDEFKKIYIRLLQNVEESNRVSWQPIELRNKLYSDFSIELSDILYELFAGVL